MRRFIKEKHALERLFADCTKKKFHNGAGECDVLDAGLPCQPFSGAGKHLGEQDPRCVHHHILQYIRRHRPRIVILENVKGLVTHLGERTSSTPCQGPLADVTSTESAVAAEGLPLLGGCGCGVASPFVAPGSATSCGGTSGPGS